MDEIHELIKALAVAGERHDRAQLALTKATKEQSDTFRACIEARAEIDAYISQQLETAK